MRNLFSSKYMYLTAAMLTGAAMFTSCSNEDDMGNVNPTYDGESVKTQFAINIPYTSNANTRMSADNTQSQGTPTFLGMYNIKLIPMTETGADNKDFTSILSLAAITVNGANDLEESFRKVYSDVNVPVGTKNFLFYGTGGADAPTTANDKFAEGIINANITGSNTKDISFALEGAKGTDTNNECTKLITVLNNVASVANWSTSGNAILKELYTNFITLKAGSANSICKTLERLYNEVDVLATVTGTPESAETTIAKAIQAAITKDNTFTKSGDSAPYTLTTTLTYPRNMNMPDGSATVSFSNSSFAPGTTGVTTNPSIDMANICYPASIYYIANTPLKATDATTITWPSTLDSWTDTENTNYPFKDWKDIVSTSTRGIALKDAIQYGVAKLALNIKCKTTTLPDASGTASISVPNEGFTVTGILVGGQPASAKWDLTPSGEATTTFTKTIYDKDVIENMAAKYNVASANNYTLVLDNKATTAQTVNIAIELKNTSTSDFKGKDGIVPAGGTFYLLAQLNPNAASGVTKPSGVTDVFMKDYTTTANLSITSLENAYNVIPDLRASQLELGLAVDLDWKKGMSFDVEIK